MLPPASISTTAASDGPLTVAVCDASGRLTVWLDAHHLASPVEHQLLTAAAASGAQQGPGQAPSQAAPLVAAFAACRLDLGSGPAFLAALSASDGSLHMLQVGQQGIFAKQLAAPAAATESRSLVGALGSALSRAYTDAFDPSARYLRRTPSPRPALALHVSPAAGGGQHFRLLALTADCLDCWTISVGLRPSESLQWSFLNCLVRQHDSRRGPAAGGQGLANIQLAVAGQHVAVWMAEGRRGTAGGGGGAVEEAPQHVVQLLELLPEGGPGVCSRVHDVVEGYSEPADAASGAALRRLLYAPHSNTCLLARWQQQQQPHSPAEGPGPRTCQALWTWNAATGTAATLLDDPDTAAVDVTAAAAAAPPPHDRTSAAGAAGDMAAAAAAAPPAARWVILSATYGVVEISATAEPAAAAAGDSGSSAGLDPAAAIANLLDAVLSQATAITAAGGNLHPLVSGLGRRLGALGALSSSSGQATLAHYSTQLLDLLPKQWAGGDTALAAAAAAAAAAPGGGGGGGGVSVSVVEQLTSKEVRQSLLLQCLAVSGVLHALEPEVLRVLIENSEKLAVVVALHRLQAQQRDTALMGGAHGAAGGGGQAAAAAALLSRLVAQAGQESSAREYEVLSPAEIFYARPSVSVGHFIGALGRAAAEVAAQAGRGLGHPGDSDLASLRSTVRELGSLVAVAVAAAVGRRDQLSAAHHLNCYEVAGRLGRPDWLAGHHTREALVRLAEAVQSVRPSPVPYGPSLDLSRTLFGVTDVLLTCFAAAVAATTRDPAARTALLSEYRAVRGRYAEELLADALAEMRAAEEARLQAAGGEAAAAAQRSGPPSSDLMIWQLEALCRAHHCYPQLFEVCEALAAADPAQGSRLYTHMATLPPEEGGAPGDAPTLATYVFGRLLADGRPADLLDLPQQFHAGVTSFLQSRLPACSDLLATHLLRSGAFEDAAAVLYTAVAGDKAGTAGGGGGRAGGPGAGCLGSHRRLLSVARLAARAGGAEALEGAALLQLRLLGLQARLGLPADGPPLEPAVLLDEALAAANAPSRSGAAAEGAGAGASSPEKEAAVAAVEVLALMPAAERSAHTSKWQLSWKAVYDADSWEDVAAARAAAEGDGGGDEGAWRAVLAGTAVCRAAAACAGSDALGFGASVVDSAPLDQVARWLRTWAIAGKGQGQGAAGRPGGSPTAAGSAGDASERRVAAVMAALQLGVEGAATAAAAGSREAAAGGGGGPLDMVIG